jgi:hypothetical protein
LEVDVSAEPGAIQPELACRIGDDHRRVRGRPRLASRRLVRPEGTLGPLRRIQDQGRVWWLQDKTCRDGITRRTELFIHSEETASNGQSCSSAYDDPFCWERESDYYSLGCIKLARPSPVASFPNDLGAAHATYHDYGGRDAHGAFNSPDSNELYVYS